MQKKTRDILIFLLSLLVLVLLNVAGSQYFFRLDLTADDRFTIAEATVDLLENMEETVYLEVYLAGEFPAGYERLQRNVRETLEEFRAYAGENIQYSFVDPTAAESDSARKAFIRQLASKGLKPTNLKKKEKGGQSQRIVIPGAMVRGGGKEVPVMLMTGNTSASEQEMLNQSIENVEYQLAKGIQSATVNDKPDVALITGHGELEKPASYQMVKELRPFYDVKRIHLPSRVKIPTSYKAIIVAKPDTFFREREKFKIDQYLMRGGNALFFVDPMNIALDSIGEKGTMALPHKLNLKDFFFNYGVRLNPDLVKDRNSSFVRMVVGYRGNKPQMEPVPWHYFPIINKFAEHPVTRNMDAVLTRFVSSIDSVKAEGIRKTPLLFTSQYSRVKPSPARVSFNEAKQEASPKRYNQSHIPIAYLLEGKFESLFLHRKPISDHTKKVFDFVPQGEKEGKLLVVADGDFVKNEINRDSTKTLPLGYDRTLRFQFSNKDFLLNALSYMSNENGIIEARNKRVTVRPLDPKVEDLSQQLQLLNLGAPLGLLLVIGVVLHLIRKRKNQPYR